VIFFDIDDTLLDQLYAERTGALEFWQEHRHLFPFGAEEFLALWRTLAEKHMDRHLAKEVSFVEQRRGRIRELFSHIAVALSDDEADERFGEYLRRYEANWRSFPDVIPCLDALRPVPLGVISNGDYRQQIKKLERMGLRNRFAIVAVSGEVGAAKPAPEIFWEACRRAQREPRACVYVGDRLDTDARASQAAGLRGIWLNRRSARADGSDVTVIHSLRELPGVVDVK
jgi:putative hydrolase of the HAD superfamily